MSEVRTDALRRPGVQGEGVGTEPHEALAERPAVRRGDRAHGLEHQRKFLAVRVGVRERDPLVRQEEQMLLARVDRGGRVEVHELAGGAHRLVRLEPAERAKGRVADEADGDLDGEDDA